VNPMPGKTPVGRNSSGLLPGKTRDLERALWPRVLWVTGWVLLAAMIVHLAALAVTGGPVTGPVSLRKPATFAETGWLVCWSVALILPLLRTRAWQAHLIGASAALFAVGETTIIGVQAWRGVPSHYNFATPLDAALMRGGAAGTAGIFLTGVIVMLVAALRTPRMAPGVRVGVVAGTVVLLAGCVVGFTMVSNNSGVFQGAFGSGFGDRTAAYLGPAPATVGREYPLIRPDTAGGDLVLPHAIGVHGLILLAVPAILLARTTAAHQARLAAVAAASVGTAMAVLIVHALRQLPLHALHPAVLALLALCGIAYAATLLATARAVVATRRHPAPTPR
jgi:hypothetical protein